MYTKNFVKQKSGNTDTLGMLVGKSFTKIVIIDFPRHYFLSEEKNLLIFLFTTEEKITSCLFVFYCVKLHTKFTILTILQCTVLWH